MTNTKLLITSGVHGDEYSIIPFVKKAVEKYKDQLGDFIFIPEVSPSALKAKTRANDQGKDANRVFFEGTTSKEAEKIMDMLKDQRFDIHVDFHEDVVLHDFYLYDTPQTIVPENLKKFIEEIKQLRIGLYNGLDDPEFGIMVKDGYAHFDTTANDNSLESWMRFTGRTKNTLVIEVPGLVQPEIKDKIVDAVFRHLLLK